MRIANLANVAVAAPVALLILAGCGSSKAAAPKTASVSSVASKSTAAKASASKTTAAAKASGQASGSADCTALKSAVAGMTVNWQLVAQLPKETDVAKWAEMSKTIGTLPQFGTQLDTLDAQLGGNADAKKAIGYMKGANDIVQKGLAGDANAPAQLAHYLGSDLTATLTKQTGISIAMDAAHCA